MIWRNSLWPLMYVILGSCINSVCLKKVWFILFSEWQKWDMHVVGKASCFPVYKLADDILLTKKKLTVKLTFSSCQPACSSVPKLPHPGLWQVRKQSGESNTSRSEKSQGVLFQVGEKLTFCRKVRENVNNFTLGLEGRKKLLRLLWSQWCFFFNEEKNMLKTYQSLCLFLVKKFYFYWGKVRKFWDVMSVVTMKPLEVVST